jgi:hypothetical protein
MINPYVKTAVKAKAGEKKSKIAKPLPFVASKNSKKVGKKAPLVDSVVNTDKESVVDAIVKSGIIDLTGDDDVVAQAVAKGEASPPAILRPVNAGA